tara:strand:+ start:1198 stop:1842 length:645 start_codon:yes stop_codon:yes gene_type:complete
MEFEYFFENDNHKMENPIPGSIALYSNNRFYLTFDSPNNHIIQIYNNNFLQTFFIEEEEIHIDNITNNSGIFIQEIFGNYKDKYTVKHSETSTQNIFTLIPIKDYYEDVFNDCIDELQLPSCLKLPKQCRIGINHTNQKLLNNCLEENNGHIASDIINVRIEINKVTNKLTSITQKRQYNNTEEILIKKTGIKEENLLTIDSVQYSHFEIIDLR